MHRGDLIGDLVIESKFFQRDLKFYPLFLGKRSHSSLDIQSHLLFWIFGSPTFDKTPNYRRYFSPKASMVVKKPDPEAGMAP